MSCGLIVENAYDWSTSCLKEFLVTLILLIILSMNVLSCKSITTEKLEGYFDAKRIETGNLKLRLKCLPKEVILRHKKIFLQLIFVRLSDNYWKIWITLRLFTRLMMKISLLAKARRLF